MKSLGRDKSPKIDRSLRLAATEESVVELRGKLDGFSANLKSLQKTLKKNHFWLPETFWQIRSEVQTVIHDHQHVEDFAVNKKILELTLDLEYCEDRYQEFYERLPEWVNIETNARFDEFMGFLHAAELVATNCKFELLLSNVDIYSGQQWISEDTEEVVNTYLQRLDSPDFEPMSAALMLRLFKLRVDFGSFAKQLEFRRHLCEVRIEKAAVKKANEEVERAKLNRFTAAHQAVQVECENLKQWLCGPTTEDYLNEIYRHVLPVRQAMSELGLAVGALQHHPNYNTFMVTYQADSGLSSFMIRAADKAAERYERSATRSGRLANWLDDVLSSKGSP